MRSRIANNCLIVVNSYKKQNFTQAISSFKKELRNKYNKEIVVKQIQLLESANLRGNLTGYLDAHRKLQEHLSKKELKSIDNIIYIHDAGLAIRMFPLSYESGDPSKSTIKFPQGLAIEIVLSCIAKSIPLIKGALTFIPIDQYFIYNKIDLKGLYASIDKYTFSTILTPVPIKRALKSLGVAKLNSHNQIKVFHEKVTDEKIILKYTNSSTLANTFQLFTTIENLTQLQKAVAHFSSKKENKYFVKELNDTEWSFNRLISEPISLDNVQLSPLQIAMKESLEKYNITFGGAIAKGYWEDWASSITAYVKLVRKLTQESRRPAQDNNYFIRSKKIKCSGKLKSCIFLDCDTIDLFGDYENCIFVNCGYIRLLNCVQAENSLFYSLKKLNFLRRKMSNYFYARFMSGRRHIEFECELDANIVSSYWMMRKIAEDWQKYHEFIKNPSGGKN